jgi:hypothetical protein
MNNALSSVIMSRNVLDPLVLWYVRSFQLGSSSQFIKFIILVTSLLHTLLTTFKKECLIIPFAVCRCYGDCSH